jgi:Patatin-like phospholipase
LAENDFRAFWSLDNFETHGMSEPGTPTQVSSQLTAELPNDGLCRILSLDGGGAKGFYTLGALEEIEGMLKSPLYKRFDLIFGTSTGAIIAALLALGFQVGEIHELYKKYVPEIMKVKGRDAKSQALQRLAAKVFGDKKFDAVKTGVGIVATKWVIERDDFQSQRRAGTRSRRNVRPWIRLYHCGCGPSLLLSISFLQSKNGQDRVR